MELVPSIGLGFCPPKGGGQAEQWIRVVRKQTATLLCMSNVHEHGWSAYWPKGSGILLDLATTGAIAAGTADWVRAAMTNVQREFVPAVNRVLFADAKDKAESAELIGWPRGTLFLAEIIGGNLRVEWIGAGTATLIRDGRVMARTKPHTLYEQAVELGATADILANYPTVIALTICEEYEHAPETWTPPMPLQANDCLVVVEGGPRRIIDDKKLCELAARHDTPTATAQAIAHATQSSEQFCFAAVAVVRWTGA